MTQINAVEQASEAIKGIPYVEFTSELIDGVFNTLIDTHTKQVQTFMELFEGVSQGLESYISNTVSDIDHEETIEFLQNIPSVAEAPVVGGGASAPTMLEGVVDGLVGPSANATVTVATTVANALTGELSVPNTNLPTAISGVTSPVTGKPNETKINVQPLFDAIAQRIAANRFGVLENMMQMGMMRLVVDSGELETSIKIKTFERHKDVVTDKTKDKDRLKTKAKTRTKSGKKFRMFGKSRTKNKVVRRKMHISKHSELHKDVSGSSVGIAARVKLNFSTDHMSLGD